jgi:hypothetical protein
MRELRLAETPHQLSFSFGSRSLKRPEMSTFRLPALGSSSRELKVGEKVLVQLLDEDGDMVASMYAECSSVGFRRHKPAAGARRGWIERVHTLELDS